MLDMTCQADTVTGSSLTPSVALLVHPSGTAHSILSGLSSGRTEMMPVHVVAQSLIGVSG